MPQSFRPLNMEEECTLLVTREGTTTPQVAKASNSRVLGIYVHHNFPLISLWNANFKCVKWHKSL
jgi:hypothetical protein